jgi:poly-beta-1,6-N-acetyl-D-glucosamine synthase
MDPIQQWTPFEPSVTMLGVRVRNTYRGPGRSLVVALVSAHNAEDRIESAIQSLRDQETTPNLIVVCADNCTDGTVALARAAGAFVYETTERNDRDALNQALDIVLSELVEDDAVLVMEAHSALPATFLSEATDHLRDGIEGVGGVTTRRPGGFIGTLRRNQYSRYAPDVSRLRGKIMALTGAPTVFSVRTLRHIVSERTFTLAQSRV